MPNKKLLVPVDGSDSALRALEWALDETDADVLVLNVQPPIFPSRFVSKAMIAEHQKRGAEEALASARALLERVKRDADVHTAIGEPAAAIVAFAKKRRCSQIVMGSRGQGQMTGLMLGSVAAKVIYLATVPVTVVK